MLEELGIDQSKFGSVEFDAKGEKRFLVGPTVVLACCSHIKTTVRQMPQKVRQMPLSSRRENKSVVTISFRPETLHDCRTGAAVEVQAGRTSDPAVPFFIAVDELRWTMTQKETSRLASGGARISRRFELAARKNEKPEAALVFRQKLFAGETETSILLALFVEGDQAGVELGMADTVHRFVDRNAVTFLIILQRLASELSEWRRAQPGAGVAQSQVNADDYFRWKHPELAWLYD